MTLKCRRGQKRFQADKRNSFRRKGTERKRPTLCTDKKRFVWCEQQQPQPLQFTDPPGGLRTSLGNSQSPPHSFQCPHRKFFLEEREQTLTPLPNTSQISRMSHLHPYSSGKPVSSLLGFSSWLTVFSWEADSGHPGPLKPWGRSAMVNRVL